MKRSNKQWWLRARQLNITPSAPMVTKSMIFDDVAYGRIPWNDEVPLYFENLFYAEFFLEMKPNYNDLPSKFFGPGKGQLCDHRGARCNVELPLPEPLLVSRPLRVENLRLEMDAKIGRAHV